MGRPRSPKHPSQRAHFHDDPASLLRPAHEGGAGEARPLPHSRIDPFEFQRWRLEVWILLDLCPRPYLGTGVVYHRRALRGIHAMLLDHGGVVSRLLIYHQLPDYLPPRRTEPSRKTMPKGFWNAPYTSLDNRHRRQVTAALSEGKRIGLWRMEKLSLEAPNERVPGARCPVCRLHVSPADCERLRSCGGSSTQSGGSSTQNG